MSKYTAELREIIEELGVDIFDFTYTRKDDSKLVVSDTDLQAGFIDHFYFREIGFETVERFKKRLSVQWKESLGELDTLLVAYAEPIRTKVTASTQIEDTTTDEGNSKVYDIDTPKSGVSEQDILGHASHITKSDSSANGRHNQIYGGFSGITEIELLEKLHDKIKDIQTEFYESFDNLFMQIY